MRENADQNNFEYGHVSCSGYVHYLFFPKLMSGEEETTTDDITLSRDYFRKPLGKTLIQRSFLNSPKSTRVNVKVQYFVY